MTRHISDPDVQLLAAIAGTLKGDYEEVVDPWIDSPFAWVIRVRSSRRRGKIGEQLVAGWCAAKGLDVLATGDSEADRIIGGHRAEIKFSTLWENGTYTFQQIREQNYNYLICLGLSPFDAHCWVIPKSLLREHVIGHTPQHMGQRGTDTFWLRFPVTEPPTWLAACGGTLAQAFQILKQVTP